MVTWAQEDELENDEEAQVEDGGVDSEADSSEVKADTNVSFQVRGHYRLCCNTTGVAVDYIAY